MTSDLYDTIRSMTSDRFDDDSVGPGPIKVLTFRPKAYTIHLVDALAQELAISRQSLLDHIIDSGIREAINAYCDAHGTESDNVKKQFLDGIFQTWNIDKGDQS